MHAMFNLSSVISVLLNQFYCLIRLVFCFGCCFFFFFFCYVLVPLETQYISNCFNKNNTLCKTSLGYSADLLSLARITEIQPVFNSHKNDHVGKCLTVTVSHRYHSIVCVHSIIGVSITEQISDFCVVDRCFCHLPLSAS